MLVFDSLFWEMAYLGFVLASAVFGVKMVVSWVERKMASKFGGE